MKLKIFLIVVVCLLSGSLSSAQAQTKPCGCEDKEDLLNLLNWTDMAIQEYQFQLGLLEEMEKAENRTVIFSDDGYKKLWESVNGAIGAVRQKGYGITMNTNDCSISGMESQSLCVQEFHDILYHYLQKACMSTLPSREGKPGSYLEGMKMSQIIVQTILAYKSARNWVLRTLQSLPKGCRPNDWFGYVVYQKVKTDISVEARPPVSDPNGTGIGPSTNIQSSKDTYIGTVFVERGKAVNAKAYAAQKMDNTSNGSSRCRSFQEGFIERVSTGGLKFSAEKETKGIASFTLDVHPARKTYDLRVRFFPVDITGQRIAWGKGPGGGACSSKIYETNNAYTLTVRAGESEGHYVSDQKIDPSSPDHLQGSLAPVKPFLLNESEKVGNISYTKTYEIQFRWVLRRLPAR